MDTLDAKALRIFMAVVRYGSIRSAAERLNLAPSVVSRQIADTERNVGLPLFDRTSRGVGLTEAGELVLEHGRRVLDDNGLLAEQLDELRGVQQGRVRLQCGEGFLGDLLEHGLTAFAAVYPTIRYAVSLGSTETILDGVANGDADIGVAYDPVADIRIRSLAISRQPLYLVAPLGHALLNSERALALDFMRQSLLPV